MSVVLRICKSLAIILSHLSLHLSTGPPTEPGFSQGFFFFFFILSQREFWFLAAVASGLLSWGHLISSDYRQLDFTDTI